MRFNTSKIQAKATAKIERRSKPIRYLMQATLDQVVDMHIKNL